MHSSIRDAAQIFAGDPEAARIREITWDEVTERFRERFNSYEFWMLILDRSSSKLLIQIEERHYEGPNNDLDLDVMVTEFKPEPFLLVAARKKNMPAHKLAYLLRRFGGIDIPERQIVARDVICCVTQRLVPVAATLAVTILRDADRSEISFAGVPVTYSDYVN